LLYPTNANQESVAVGDGFNVSEASTEESNGEIPEGLPGSKSVACSERSIRNLGDPSTSTDLPIDGRTAQSQKRLSDGLTKRRESDHLIVL
jgi:hypothetical protein